MLLSRCALVMAFVLASWTAVDGHYYMMKALLHGAGVGMMLQTMRPRLLPIPIPFPTGMFSGFQRQFDKPHVVVVPHQKPQERFIILQNPNKPEYHHGW